MEIGVVILDEAEMRKAVELWLNADMEKESPQMWIRMDWAQAKAPVKVTSCKQVQSKRERLFAISIEQGAADAGSDSIPEEG